MPTRKSPLAPDSKYGYLQKSTPKQYRSIGQSTQLFWRGIGFTIAGLFSGVLAIYEYKDLTLFEEQGGVRMMQAWVRVIYAIGGKWGVVGAIVLIAAGCLFMGLLMLRALVTRR